MRVMPIVKRRDLIVDDMPLSRSRIRRYLNDEAGVAGRRFECLAAAGGGSPSMLLNRLCAAVTGIPVLAGSAEATAIGWRNRLCAANREVFPMLASLCDCHVCPP